MLIGINSMSVVVKTLGETAPGQDKCYSFHNFDPNIAITGFLGMKNVF